MIGKKDECLEEALSASRYAIGDSGFIEQAEADLKELHLREAVFGDVMMLPTEEGVALARVEEAVGRSYGVAVGDLHGHGRRAGVAKSVAIELCCMLSGKTQRDIAKHFGFKTDAGISRQRRVLGERLSEDAALRRKIQNLAKQLAPRNI
jgi:chromosomal replication initiation ATPase DnaA